MLSANKKLWTSTQQMTKRIKKLEKDGMTWKNKWEASNKGLLEMMEAVSALLSFNASLLLEYRISSLFY